MGVIDIEVTTTPHKIITVQQLAQLVDRDRSQIDARVASLDKSGETKLDIAYPFPHSNREEDHKTGPKFIVRNEKCEEYIKACRKRSLNRN